MPLPPIPFPSANVPLVGQPCVIKAFSGPQVVVVCNCEMRTVLLLNGLGHVAQCPGCKRGRTIVGLGVDKTSGQISIEVADVAVEGPQ